MGYGKGHEEQNGIFNFKTFRKVKTEFASTVTCIVIL